MSRHRTTTCSLCTAYRTASQARRKLGLNRSEDDEMQTTDPTTTPTTDAKHPQDADALLRARLGGLGMHLEMQAETKIIQRIETRRRRVVTLDAASLARALGVPFDEHSDELVLADWQGKAFGAPFTLTITSEERGEEEELETE